MSTKLNKIIFDSENEANDTRVYSGDLSNFTNVKILNIKMIRRIPYLISMVKLCPAVKNYKPISLIESDNFNYQTNTTGKVVYFHPIKKVQRFSFFQLLFK
jgi:hypothetical protein